MKTTGLLMLSLHFFVKVWPNCLAAAVYSMLFFKPCLHRTFASTVGCNSVCPLQHAGLMVAVVTAAGYPGADGARKFVPAPPPNCVLDCDPPSRYEARLRGLLDAMISQGMDAKTTRRFFVLGGECNYLCQCNSGVLEPIEFNSLHVIFEPT